MYFVLYFGLSSFLLFNFVHFLVTFLLIGYIVFVVACMFYFMLFILLTGRKFDVCPPTEVAQFVLQEDALSFKVLFSTR